MPFLVGKENITCYDAVFWRADPLLSSPVFCYSATGGLLWALCCCVCSASPGLQDMRFPNHLVSPTTALALRRIRFSGLSGLEHLSRRGEEAPMSWQPWCRA